MPQVYKATYSNVPVWMANINGVSVMRRQADGWVNATHLLKVADLDKPRRTRILERDVQTGEHEKVQGGYGKYQGTWIPVTRALQLAQQFGIMDMVHDLLLYQPSSDTAEPLSNMPRPPKPTPAAHSASTSAAPARRTATEGGAAAHPKPKRARKTLSAPPPPARRQQAAPPAAPAPPQPVYRPAYNRARANDTVSPSSSVNVSSESDYASDEEEGQASWPQRPMPPPSVQGNGPVSYRNHQMVDAGQAYMADFSTKLLDFFMSTDKSEVPEMLLNPRPGPHINQPIDDEGNTAFHWTCAMGQIQVMEALMAAGADIKAVNYAGHTPLVRAIMFTNNYDLRSFPKVLELLKPTMFFVDAQGSTLLHHIAAAAASRSRASSTRYYMEILLSKMSENQYPGSDQSLRQFVNHMDINGDTALHIASRNCSRKLVKVLLSHHALPDIANKIGRTSQEYIWEYEAQRRNPAANMLTAGGGGAPSSSPPRSFMGTPAYSYGRGPGQSFPPNLAGNTMVPNAFTGPGGLSTNPSGAIGANNHPHGPGLGGPIVETVNGPIEQHVSEAAVRAVQEAPPQIMDLLSQLARTYDDGLSDKDTDIEQVRQLLEQVKQKIMDVQAQIPELQQRLGTGQLVNFEVERLRDAEQSYALQLRKILERTQARDLALIVQKEETDIQDKLKQQLETIGQPYDEVHIVPLVRKLCDMQARRRALVDEVVELYANAGVRDKMGDYRRLLALCCEVPAGEVDGLLDGIAQALDDRQ